MTTQRDDLAALIDKTINEEFSPGDDVMGTEIADHLIAAGYTRPRTITTVEELDALPVGTRLAGEECISEKISTLSYDGTAWLNVSYDVMGEPCNVNLPAIVLHEGAGA